MTPGRDGTSVSVVMTLYNKSDYVAQAVRSVLAGRVRPLEVIVVDDGSTDDGPAKVEALGDPVIRLIRQENAGVSAARNRGVEEATGDLVAFLDADDLWRPGFLESIVAQADAFPACGLFSTHYFPFTDADPIDAPPQRTHPSAGPRRIDRFYEFWVGAHPFSMSSCAVRRSWVQEEGIHFPEGESRGEDQDFVFRVAERWPISFDPRPLSGYRRGVAGQLSRGAAARLPPYLDRLRDRLQRNEIRRPERAGAQKVLRVGELMSVEWLLISGRRAESLRRLWRPRLLRSPLLWSKLVASALLPTGIQAWLLPRHPAHARPQGSGPLGGTLERRTEEPAVPAGIDHPPDAASR